MLDIGSGIGCSSCFFSRYFHTIVEGVDLSKNMIDIANERLDREDADVRERVSFTD